MKATLKTIDKVLLNSIAACGDINRNVMCNVLPEQSRAHAAAIEMTRAISDHLFRRRRPIARSGSMANRSPAVRRRLRSSFYGKTYLPRKFKIVVAVPPSNDVDIFAHDLAYIAILDNAGDVAGWNVAVGGGMGMTHGELDTYPRIAEVMGFCQTSDAVKIAEAVVTVQRDWVTAKIASTRDLNTQLRIAASTPSAPRSSVVLELNFPHPSLTPSPRPATATAHRGSRWTWALTLFVQNGRVRDVPGAAQQSALREIAQLHEGDFRITPNQNLVIASVPTTQQAEVERIAREADLLAPWSGLRRNSMACVALPTCGLALAESERYLPDLLAALDEQLSAHGLSADDIVIRMTGCPNGCARPYLAEIGFVGKGPGRYNLYLGAAFDGSRMNKLYAEDLDHAGIVAALDPVLAAYAAERQKGEPFGDFAIRAGFVAASGNGADFHANTGKQRAANEQNEPHLPTAR